MDFRLSLRNGLVSWMVVLLGISAGSPLLGSLQAQDMDAVQKRLLRAVKQRELSMEQATMMMRVLRDSSNHGAHSGQIDRGRRQPAHQEQGRQEQGRRQSGQQNEGRRVPLDRPDGRRQGTDRRPDHDRMKELERMFAQRIREIDEAVRAGEISEEEANHHRGETEQWFESQHREGGHDEEGHRQRGHDERAHHEELERMFGQRMREIEEAVRSGQISEEEANRYRMEAERWMESEHREGEQDEHEHEHEHGPDQDREEDRDGEPGEAEAAREADK